MNSVKTLFLLRTSKKRVSGKSPIYLRITVNGRRCELATKKYVSERKWKSEAQKVRGSTPFANSLNTYLAQLKREVLEAETELLRKRVTVTAQAIKTCIKGESERQTDFLVLFKTHNEKMKELIGIDFAKATFKKYQTCLKHLTKFVKYKFNQNSLLVQDINLTFINDFEHYLKTKENPCCHNSALKYMSHVKKIINLALEQEIIIKNPFKSYSETYNKKDPVYLSHSELISLQQKDLEIGRVEKVRDVFLFCCYTGLSFSDVEKLTYDDIKIDKEGEHWLFINRTKTKEPCQILLLPIPLELINKYKGDIETQSGSLLPVISNQKTNAYLKEIANLCGIKKHITFHCSRHTFATTVALENGVPIETVQKILGHKDSRSTELYARVTSKKVGREMKRLRTVI